MNSKLLSVAIVVVLAGAGAYYYFNQAGAPQGEPSDAPRSGEVQSSVEPAVDHSAVPEAVESSSKEVVAVEEKVPDLSSCDVLFDPDTYVGKYEDYEQLLPGKDGWIFRTKQDLRQDFKFTDEDAALYRAFSDALRSRGTRLVLAVIPPRGILAGAKLPEDSDLAKGYDQAAAKASFREMVLKLNAAGVLAADVSDSKAGPAFFNHADQHWTTKGAQEMAQAVAALVKQPGVWSDKVPNEVFETRTGAEETYDGRFGEPIKDLCDMKPLPEKDVTVTTFSTGGSDGENALFGDKAAPEVVLVGTSNSKRDEFNSNFAGYLQEYLSADVLNAAISGGGMDDSMVAYLDSDAFKAHAPAYVIWEIPGYYNLGGEGMENTLRQAIPSVYGFCQEPVMQFPSQKILAGEKRVYMMQGVGDQKLEIGKVYLTVDFDKPVKKDFSVSFKTSDKESSLFKFKRRREQNGDTFYYLPVPGKLVQKGLYLKDVALNVSDYLEGLTVTARLCPIPEAVAE